MQLHYGLGEDILVERTVVTTGTFDGVHIGHQVIIRRISELAAEIGGESVLITFHPHPRKVLYPDTIGKEIKMINTQREKIEMLKTTGLDHLVIMPFTREFAHTSSDSFIRDILVKKLKIKKSVVGFNHFFGFNKEGNYEQLHALGLELGFDVEEIAEQDIQNEAVSSTAIRKAISEGNIQRANAYLNHILLMMGFPEKAASADILPHHTNAWLIRAEEEEKLLPPEGIYAVRVKQEHQNIKAVAFRNLQLYPGDTMMLVPVEESLIQPEISTVLFYKQLIHGEQFASRNLRDVLQTSVGMADELIY
jgi:riboflavin kinase / FMN adenylyltransferase